jgi:hypothetical protein
MQSATSIALQRVLEQPAQERVMKAHRRGRFAEILHQRFIVEVRREQRVEMAVLNTPAQLLHAGAHLW